MSSKAMKMWSRGLGKTELKMDFRYYQVKKDSETGDVIIFGKITDPVNWEFKITLEPNDIAGFMKVFFHSCVMELSLKNSLKFIEYLKNKQKYTLSQDLENTVNNAYVQMTSRAGPTRVRKKIVG